MAVNGHVRVDPSVVEDVREVTIEIPFFIRGKVLTGSEWRFPARKAKQIFFACPDIHQHLAEIVPRQDLAVRERINAVTFDETIDYLSEVSKALNFEKNDLLREARDVSVTFSNLSEPILTKLYKGLPTYFSPAVLKDMIDREVGIDYLKGWVTEEVPQYGKRVHVRACGARTLHYIAGNVPLIAALTIARSAMLKSDTVIKLPSNDPVTATAILRTMREVDKTHPLLELFTAVYWKGGDETVEKYLFQPRHFEKIVAWGGHRSINHVKKQISPGMDLITLDPKFSISVIGKEAFKSVKTMKKVAAKAALDVGGWNQEACVNSRIIYAFTTEKKADKFSKYLYESIQKLPSEISTHSTYTDPLVKSALDDCSRNPMFYSVFGNNNGEGAVIRSPTATPVDFFPQCRVVNVVPIESIYDALERVSAQTQTVGVYPEALKKIICEPLILKGVQRFVSLGEAINAVPGTPHDSMQLGTRLVKWIVNEELVLRRSNN